MTRSILKVQDMTVGYERPLIHGLNFELNLGDRLIVYGSNGTGKSTLLHSLTKPSYQQKGQVHWGIPLEEILFIHQQPSFHSQTPDDVKSYLLNILLYKNPFKKPSSQDLSKIDEVLFKLNLTNMPLRNLSGGQRQKLKIARGLLLKTQAFLLDEPFNAIDQKSSFEIIQWLNETRKNMIQIIVLHDFEQIEKLKSPVLWIQSDGWQLLGFEDWFHQVDKQFHSWIHQIHHQNKNSSDKPSIETFS